MTMQTSEALTPRQPWWHGVTRYQWLVLAIASAGWVFDVFEGQIFGSCMNEALPDLLRGSGLSEWQELFVNIGLAAFLAGGALGGVVFGMMADRWGRRRTMAITILMYSAFTGLTALAQNWWHLAGLRFLVGMGVGGEWAVAAAAVAEVFPPRARPAASGIFHASSVLGTFLAVAAGVFIVARNPTNGWRYGFLLGVLPALMVFWVRVTMREPESWQAARQAAAKDHSLRLGRFMDLFGTAELRRHTLVGTALAIIGLATFWGTHFRGKDLLRQARRQQIESSIVQADGGKSRSESSTASSIQEDLKGYEMLGMFLATIGGGVGLLTFAPISQRLGRRPAFLIFHLGGFLMVVVVCLLAHSLPLLEVTLPVFGFFTLGMHAGYAIYFPELFPTRLRGTGAGFCFNTARLVVGPVLLAFGFLQGDPLHLSLPQAMLLLGCLFLVGAGVLVFAPETRGQPLPE
ncbi:MAG TPA: MFS transporter [Gemmataceae bacterium]|nr:MFS transporter [Gemmataceae bacterium]